jgi:hypothetical protein
MISVEKLMFKLGFRIEIVHTAIEAYVKKKAGREIRVNSMEEPETYPKRFDEAVSLFMRTKGKTGMGGHYCPTLARFIALGCGPRRIMIDKYEARAPRLVPDLKPEVVFIREDGWTLAAPAGLEAAARKQWPGQWIAVIRAKPWRMEEP